jgi:hypothetical protein
VDNTYPLVTHTRYYKKAHPSYCFASEVEKLVWVEVVEEMEEAGAQRPGLRHNKTLEPGHHPPLKESTFYLMES